MDFEFGEPHEGDRTQAPSSGERRIRTSMRSEGVSAVMNIVLGALMVAAPPLESFEHLAPWLQPGRIVGFAGILLGGWRLWKLSTRPRPAVMVLSETGIWARALRETIAWSRIEKLVPEGGDLWMTLREPLCRLPRIEARPLFRSRDAVRRRLPLPLRGLEIPVGDLRELIIAEHAARCGGGG